MSPLSGQDPSGALLVSAALPSYRHLMRDELFLCLQARNILVDQGLLRGAGIRYLQQGHSAGQLPARRLAIIPHDCPMPWPASPGCGWEQADAYDFASLALHDSQSLFQDRRLPILLLGEELEVDTKRWEVHTLIVVREECSVLLRPIEKNSHWDGAYVLRAERRRRR